MTGADVVCAGLDLGDASINQVHFEVEKKALLRATQMSRKETIQFAKGRKEE